MTSKWAESELNSTANHTTEFPAWNICSRSDEAIVESSQPLMARTTKKKSSKSKKKLSLVGANNRSLDDEVELDASVECEEILNYSDDRRPVEEALGVRYVIMSFSS